MVLNSLFCLLNKQALILWRNLNISMILDLVELLSKIRKRIADGHRVLIHCYGGLGRAVLVAACLLQVIDEDLTPDDTISQMRELRGPRAVQSVKQYNFINEFRELCIKAENLEYEDEGCVSR